MTRSPLTWLSILFASVIILSAIFLISAGRHWHLSTHVAFANAYALGALTMLAFSVSHRRRGSRMGMILCLVVAAIAGFLAWGVRPVLAR